jgi:phosphoribosylformylglycinamidine (FGAM) synthase-like enzyme
VLVGVDGPVSLGGSQWAVERRRHRAGRLAGIDLPAHARLVALVADLVTAGGLGGVHDVSTGGLGVALAEMALAADVGFVVDGVDDHVALFAESASRVLFCLPADAVAALAGRVDAAGLVWQDLGAAGGDRLVVAGLVDIALGDARTPWRAALPDALGLA